MKTNILKFLSFVFFLLYAVGMSAQAVINLDAGVRKAKIGGRHYGLFFEEINHAGDGGLYAEMIRNRSFQDNAGNPDFWNIVGNASQSIRGDVPLNPNNTLYNRVQFNAANSGIQNDGWWGCNVVEGRTYDLTFWVRAEGTYNGNVTAQLRSQAGANLGTVTVNGPFNSNWKKVTTKVKASGTDIWGRFALLGSTSGVLCFDCVSLFPPTFNNRPNGCRDDISQLLVKMKPKFFRFPGGCVIEGNWVNERNNRFEWKKTIGPIEERPGHLNANWWYEVSDGFGFDEMLTLAEDLGAEPLFVVNMGFGHGWEDPDLQPYIQEALDAIEYCNGDETTYWGKKRIENGHKEPYNLRLLEIGNENYGFAPYSARYNLFQQAIHKKYPYIEFVGDDAWIWGLPWPVDIVDQHYYMSPSWFRESYGRYDDYSRAGHKVYVGEYAVTQFFGGNGNLDAALGEAVFMMGMENNSDVCVMNSYAPMFTHEDSYGWRPDMIRFNCNYVYGTPSYHVQQMMSANHGDENIAWEEVDNDLIGKRGIALSSWGTSVKYDNITVKAPNGTVLYENDFSDTDLSDWTSNGGTWNVTDGELCQTSTSMHGDLFILNKFDFGRDYTLELDATKVSGTEGFLVAFNVYGKQDYDWWNIGGWGNKQHALESAVGGGKVTTDDGKKEGSIKNMQTYHIKIEVADRHVKCYMDNELIHECNVNTVDKRVFISSNITEDEKTLYIKAVNYLGEAQDVTFNLKHGSYENGTLLTLTSPNITDENNIMNPNYVSPTSKSFNANGNSFKYKLPAHSLCIFKMNVHNVEVQVPEEEEIPTPLLKYSFEQTDNISDPIDGTSYKFTPIHDSKRVGMYDGNKVFYTGTKGYASLDRTIPKELFSKLTGDYSVAIDILMPDVANFGSYCWAYCFNYNTQDYIGLISAGNNVNWYYEFSKNNTRYGVHSGGGMMYEKWHNVVLSQKDGVATLYIDGYPEATNNIGVTLSQIANTATSAYLGRSPFSGDAIMAKTYFDDFTIYDEALSQQQVKQLSEKTMKKSMKVGTPTAVQDILHQSEDADVLFNLDGTVHKNGEKGIVVKDGKKFLVK